MNTPAGRCATRCTPFEPGNRIGPARVTSVGTFANSGTSSGFCVYGTGGVTCRPMANWSYAHGSFSATPSLQSGLVPSALPTAGPVDPAGPGVAAGPVFPIIDG